MALKSGARGALGRTIRTPTWRAWFQSCPLGEPGQENGVKAARTQIQIHHQAMPDRENCNGAGEALAPQAPS